MSYISAYNKNNEIWVWERHDPYLPRKIVKYPAIYEFYVKHNNGNYRSLYDEPLRKFEYNNYAEFFQFKQLMSNHGTTPLYESDISPELKLLSQKYYETPAPKLNFTVWDIEVDYDPTIGFSSVENPYAPINAIALHHIWKDQSVIISVPPKNNNWKREDIEAAAAESNSTLYLVDNERELLKLFLKEIQDSDCISGWNSSLFDSPYTAKRIERVLGSEFLRMLSFEQCSKPSWTTTEIFGEQKEKIQIYGRIDWDMMDLFKKFEPAERPSYKLEAISNEILPELPKLEYDGTLHSLYNNDYAHFIRYNGRDTEVLKGFEKKLGYLQLANVLYHTSCGLADHIHGTIKLTDLAMINYCHYVKNVIVPDVDVNAAAGRIGGAMVLTPKRGLHTNIGSVDVESLYPSAIRTVNISPDVLIGQFDGVLSDDDRQMHNTWKHIFDKNTNVQLTLVYDKHAHKLGYSGTETHTGAEWFDIIYERKWSISGFGTVFRQDVQGMIPAVLSEWFKQRKHYKKLKDEAQTEADLLKAKYKDSIMPEAILKQYNQALEQSAYYDRLQYVYKIKLNATYGATTNAFFRFFDLRLGQSTTGSGRAILDHMCSQIAFMLDGKYDFTSESIIYGDTDSCYFKTNVEHFNIKDKEKMYEKSIQIADVIGKQVCDSFDDFCVKAFRIQDEYNGIIRCEREIVAKAGIFVTKKRYVLKLIDKDGRRVNKLKAMGLEMKKTTTPKVIQGFLENVVNMILDGEKTWNEIDNFIVDYRNQVAFDLPLLDIGLPKGVKKIEYYTNEYKVHGSKARLPGHVAASIHFNECIKEYNDTELSPITSGSKIKVFYLTKKYGKFKSIAVPTDLEVIPEWLTANFTVDRFLHEEKTIDGPLTIIFEAISRPVPTLQSLFNDSVLEW